MRSSKAVRLVVLAGSDFASHAETARRLGLQGRVIVPGHEGSIEDRRPANGLLRAMDQATSAIDVASGALRRGVAARRPTRRLVLGHSRRH